MLHQYLSDILAMQVAPWSKTGGLGDVCGSLPPALAARGHRVMVVAPQYQNYPEPSSTGASVLLYAKDIDHGQALLQTLISASLLCSPAVNFCPKGCLHTMRERIWAALLSCGSL